MIKRVVLVLLLVNGVGAIYGGWQLMRYSDGSSFKMPLYLLAHSPFIDFFIPGILLFTVNGVLSLVIFLAVILNFKNYPLLIMAQGIILTGWIVIEVAMLRGIHYLHLIFGAIGLILIICGLVIKNKIRNEIAVL